MTVARHFSKMKPIPSSASHGSHARQAQRLQWNDPLLPSARWRAPLKTVASTDASHFSAVSRTPAD